MRTHPFARYFAAFLATCLLCPAQQPGETPTFRTGTTLIEFTIVALDSDGNPVTDLKQEEITITEDGRRRDVAVFRFEGGTEEDRRIEALPPGIYTNRPEYLPGPPRNITAIVLDSLNTLPDDQIFVRALVMRYLREIAPDSRVAVYRIGEGVTILHDFTDDLASLRERISKGSLEAGMQANVDMEQLVERDAAILSQVLSPTAGAALAEALAANRRAEDLYRETVRNRLTELTLESLQALGSHLAGIPGRKSLVWITAGVPTTDSFAGWRANYEPAIRAMAQRLASQGVAIYPVDAKGLDTRSPQALISHRGQLQPGRPSSRLPSVAPQGRLWATMDIVASVTGGRATRNTNDLTQGVKAAAADARGAYTVGFYAVGEPDGRWRRLEVKVPRRGVRLTHRQGYLAQAAAQQPQDWTEAQWSAVLFNPLGSAAVRFDALCKIAKTEEEAVLIAILQIAGDDLAFRPAGEQLAADLEVVIAGRTAEGKFIMRRENVILTRPGDPTAELDVARLARRWQIDLDTPTLRLIVRDRFTGRHGTLDIPVKEILGEAVATPAEAPAK
jgi:VWFA-related protein